MSEMFNIIGGGLFLIATVILIVAAFKEDTLTGVLTWFLPFYIIYFMFAKYDSPRKGLVIGSWWLGIIIPAMAHVALK